MNYSEIINICVSAVSIFIASLALFQTKRQIALSNKQHLFDRRLARYLEFGTIYALYTTNKNLLEGTGTFCHTNNLIFAWLTNCSDLAEMMFAVSNPLHQEEQNVFLAKCEQLKNAAVEISMIFDGSVAKIAGDFIASYADLLKAMYQQQVYISRLEEQNKKTPLTLENYENKCNKMAEELGLFKIRDNLRLLADEIVKKGVIEEMEDSLRLTKVKR